MTLGSLPQTIEWIGQLDGHVALIDQTLLPEQLRILEVREVEALYEAIQQLRVRGAPAIGIAAAMGLVLGVRDLPENESAEHFWAGLQRVSGYLASARPTAVNLVWALKRMERRARATIGSVGQIKAALLAEAKAIRDEDAAKCRAIGAAGEHLIPEGGSVLTHCNAGSLATAEYGTALAVMYAAYEKGRQFKVYADETRPLLQGSRLTAWELSQAGLDVTVLCDSMAGWLMHEGKVDLIITGADRIAANGDAANKIGTYSLAVLAKAHKIPFYVAAPSSTFDLSLADGGQIPIEHRSEQEICCGFGRQTAPEDVPCYNPAFDVTPARLIQGIITEHGLISPVGPEAIRRRLADSG